MHFFIIPSDYNLFIFHLDTWLPSFESSNIPLLLLSIFNCLELLAVVSTLLNFVRMFIRARDENCKQLELEKKKIEKEAETPKMKMGALQAAWSIGRSFEESQNAEWG